MTLLARRREELARESAAEEELAEATGAVVRRRPAARGFHLVQEALGNHAAAGLLRSGLIQRKARGETLASPGANPAAKGATVFDFASLQPRPPAAADPRSVRVAGLAAADSGTDSETASRPPSPVAESEPQSGLETADRPESSDPAGARSRSPALLVADDAIPAAGQMTRGAFLAALHDAAGQAAERGLAGTELSARGCPWIAHYFRLYRRLGAERIEADLRRWVPAVRKARSAADSIAPAALHIERSVRHWAATGRLTGVPPGLPGMRLLGALGGSLEGVGRLLRKALAGRAAAPAPDVASPAAVTAELGPGRAFAGGARQRMEGVFGHSFSGVRLHTGPAAGRLASRLDARAFAVGRHVAFGAGEYRPGTPVGDALLAHELAHTLQHRGGGRATNARVEALEDDADRAAAQAVGSLWAGQARTEGGRQQRPQPERARPRLAAGLALQRCSGDKPGTKQAEQWVELGGGHALTAHGDNKKANPVWNRGSTDHAAAYTRGASPSLNAKLKVPATLGGAAGSPLDLRVKEAGQVKGSQTGTKSDATTVRVSGLVVSGLTDSDRVRAREYDMVWEASAGGTTWQEIESTDDHLVYWLHAAPRTSPLHTTAVMKATRYAEGQTAPQGIAAALRSGIRRQDSLDYNPADPINPDPLTMYDDGTGICTDYANLLTVLARSLGVDAKAVLYWGGFRSIGKLVWLTLAGRDFISLLNVRSPNDAFNPPTREPFSPHGWAFNYHAVSRIDGVLHDAALDRTGVSGQAVHDGKVVRLVELAAAAMPAATVGTSYDRTIQRKDHTVALTTQDFPGLITTADFGKVYTVPLATGAASPHNVPVTWTVVGGSLPPGLTLETASGRVHGTPTSAGSYTAVIRVSAPGLVHTVSVGFTVGS